MIKDIVNKKLAQIVVTEEDRPGLDRLSRRALGVLAGVATFAGLGQTVKANPCTANCSSSLPGCGSIDGACSTSCNGYQCWEGGGGYCCDYHCTGTYSPRLCCSIYTQHG